MENKPNKRENEKARLARLFAMLTLMQDSPGMTAADMARLFGLDVKAIFRDIHTLELAGAPIRMDENKGYTLAQSDNLPPIRFTREEANALVSSETLLSVKGLKPIEGHQEAIAKMKSVLSVRQQLPDG